MAQYAPISPSGRPVEVPEVKVANPTPLGLIAFGFGTAVMGCVFAGFIVPYNAMNLGIVAASVMFLLGGLVQILAGMWEFRRNHTVEATLFSAYGGFLFAFGLAFLPGYGLSTAINAKIFYEVLGLAFLCWTIVSAILVVGSLKANAAYLSALVLMFLAFFFLTIGALAKGNIPLLAIGGWLAILCALVAWYAALVSLASTAHTLEETKVPLGRLAPGESMT